MSMYRLNSFFEQYDDRALFFLRLGVGVIFLVHGLGKLLAIGPFPAGIENTAAYLTSLGIPAALLAAWLVALIETLGGLTIILGLWTRLAALLLSINMLAAILVVHLPEGFYKSNGELPLLLLAATLTLLFAGPGRRWALRD